AATTVMKTSMMPMNAAERTIQRPTHGLGRRSAARSLSASAISLSRLDVFRLENSRDGEVIYVRQLAPVLAWWTARMLIASRFKALILATAIVGFTSSSSEKCRRASANTSSGTWVLETSV